MEVFVKVTRFLVHHGCRVRVTSVSEVSFPVRPGERSRYSDSLGTGRSRDQIPVGGRDFPHPFQTGPGTGV